MNLYLQDKIESLTQREPVFVSPHETLRSVAHTMWVENVGVLVVGEPQRALGMISERDVVGRIGQGGDADTLTAEQAMTRYVVAAQVGDPVHEAAFEMLDGSIRHLPVVDEGGRVVAVVSVRDLLRPLLLDALEGQAPDSPG